MKPKPEEQGRPVELLLVEDNPGDVRLVREIMRLSWFPIHLNVTRDGEEALSYLRGQKPYIYAFRPDMILLDLGLPKKDGREVLKEMKKDPGLSQIPVLILSGSREDEDVRLAYELQAQFYLSKPLALSHFSVLLKYLENFWIKSLPEPTYD